MEEEKGPKNRIVMVIAFQDFRDEEYFVTREVLEKAGMDVSVASDKTGVATGADGGEVRIDLKLSKIKPEDFDALVFVGGPGCLIHLANRHSHKVIKKFIAQDKILAALCVSPVILAESGVLKGKRATVWNTTMEKQGIKILEKHGAIFENRPVVIDGNIITGNAPLAAKDFGWAIVGQLSSH